ncbi:WXG100 family type VII secretion target [Bacillus cihuensis]|uniref:WXG100 family type VII secretion target n=1 Tax=Bacillus cihuensis TaxID=1208599 RepID=UPI000426E9B3|nr:WXG100 family type VII secretion target [Bacillus cihuensis]
MFQESSETLEINESKLIQSVHTDVATWTGKSRKKFDSVVDEASVLFQRHSDNLYSISRELESAANEVDRIREVVKRQRELEGLSCMRSKLGYFKVLKDMVTLI